MLEVYDKSRKKLAILENAFGMEETSRINSISNFKFSLPDTDPKNEYCQRFHLIRYNDGEFYRIIKDGSEETETGRNDYECEHVIASLIDTIMPDFINVGGRQMYTEDVIKFVLDKQHTKQKHWALEQCDFRREFEYGWEKENLLAALFSIPNRLEDDYIWKFDTSLYPYRISLKKLDKNKNPDHYIRKGHNRLSLIKQSDSRNICTRLYPFGAGEGVNQLTIANVNNGKLYLDSPQKYIDDYGLIERAWIDRRYTHEKSLFDAAQVMLNELQEPYVEYETEMIGNPKVGDIVQIVGGIKSFVVETTVLHEEVPQTMIKIANRPQDIASTVADLADRQRIEMTYSQGATQIYADSIADNADGETPLELRFYLPDSMIHVNAVECKIRLSRFRAYSKNVEFTGNIETPINKQEGAENTDDTTQILTGGGITDGSVIKPGGGIMYDSGFHLVSHVHAFGLPNHGHKIKTHTHKIDLKHNHAITPQITLSDTIPKSFDLIINGEKKAFFEIVPPDMGADVDITKYLVDDRKIKRGVWHTISVLPDTLARVEISYNITGFIQSHTGVIV